MPELRRRCSNLGRLLEALAAAVVVVLAAGWPGAAAAEDKGEAEAREPLRVLLRRFTDALAQEGVGRISPENARHLSVAVLPFFEHGARTRRNELGDLLTYSVRAALITDYGLLVSPPEAVRVALKTLPPGKPPGPEQAMEVGRALRADVVISGNVSDGGDHFAIQASVLDVQGKAAPVEHRVLRVGVREMIEAAENAQVLRTQLGALWRSALLPGWGQIYNRQVVKGVFVGGTEAALLTGALVFQVLGSRADARYGWGLRETVDQRAVAEDHYRSRNILLGLAAALWAYGALDAYFSGRDPDELPTLSLGDSVASLGLAPMPAAGQPGALGLAAVLSW